MSLPLRLDAQTLDMLDLVFVELVAEGLSDEDIIDQLAIGIECEQPCRPGAAILAAEAYLVGDYR